MGFTRFCHGSRIGGYEPNVFYAAPTTEAAALAARMQARLKRAGGGDAARAEREWFLQAPPRWRREIAMPRRDRARWRE